MSQITVTIVNKMILVQAVDWFEEKIKLKLVKMDKIQYVFKLLIVARREFGAFCGYYAR